MRRANVLHIAGTLLACIGAAVMTRAQISDPDWSNPASSQMFLAGVGQIMLATFCVVVAIRINRRHRAQLIDRKLRVLGDMEARVRELEARLAAADLSTASNEAAFASVTAGVTSVVAATNGQDREVRPSLTGEELIRLISHEVRTPLATIHGYSELLFDGEPPEESIRHDIFGIMQGETQRMSQVIESLLNLSRLEIGTLTPRTRQVQFGPLLTPSLERAAPLAELRRVVIDASIDQNLPKVVGDDELLAQATRNLLWHVLKYTEAGGRVSVIADKNTETGGVKLQIAGTRVGIAPKDLPSPLDSFYGGGNCDPAIPPGAAALALARRVIALHGGRTLVEVKPEEVTLGFELPAATGAVACERQPGSVQ